MFNPLTELRLRVAVTDLSKYLVGTSLDIEELQSIHPQSTHVYLYICGKDPLIISELGDGKFYLHIEREEYVGNHEDLEEILAKWAASEGYFDSPLLSHPLTVAHERLNSSSRSDILAVMQSIDPNGSWRDSAAIDDGHDFMDLEDAKRALSKMLQYTSNFMHPRIF